jgi:protein arginine kinase activator
MLCDVCSERSAVIHMARIIYGQKSEAHLCESCASQYNDKLISSVSEFSFDNFLLEMINSNPFSVSHVQNATELERCPTCGLTYGEYQQSGRLGCWNCYKYFASRLDPIFKRIHGSTRHLGKRLDDTDNTAKATGIELKLNESVDPTARELVRLKAELQEKVALEKFEDAAILRDQIKELESQVTDKN